MRWRARNSTRWACRGIIALLGRQRNSFLWSLRNLSSMFGCDSPLPRILFRPLLHARVKFARFKEPHPHKQLCGRFPWLTYLTLGLYFRGRSSESWRPVFFERCFQWGCSYCRKRSSRGWVFWFAIPQSKSSWHHSICDAGFSWLFLGRGVAWFWIFCRCFHSCRGILACFCCFCYFSI